MPDGECGIKPSQVRGIGDKTRWTKALGKAAMVVYGDCTVDLCMDRHSAGVDYDTTGRCLI